MYTENKDRIDQLRQIIEGKLNRYYGRTLENASEDDIFRAVALSIRDRILERWVKASDELEERGLKTLY